MASKHGKKSTFPINETANWGKQQVSCPHEVDEQLLLRILEDWEEGDVGAEDVYNFAEELEFSGGGFPNYPKSEQRSVWYLVLEMLSMLYTEPVLPEDIPTLRSALKCARKTPLEAWKLIDQYYEKVEGEREPYLSQTYPE